MGKVIYFSSVSLDGFIARPDGDIGWVIVDEELHKFINQQQDAIGTYLHGRRIYEMMAEFWPTADADPAAPDYIAEFARIWRNKPKVVFSTTLRHVDWNARLYSGEAGAEIARLKAASDEIFEAGGAGLAETLFRQDLIDEYQLFVNPVVLGDGRRLFPILDRTTGLKLLETRTFGSGVVFLHYARQSG